MLTFTDVTIRYGATAAVDRVSMTIGAGRWLGVIGPNGAGKSTLLRAAAHLQSHTGVIAWQGTELSGLSHRDAARLVAYVPQQPELPAGMSVLSYTLLGRTPHISYFGTESDTDREICVDLLDRLGVGALAARDVTTLSGGEIQRVVLARALAQHAPVLLLDEPTSALDIGNRVTALDLVDDIRYELGLTVVAVMHDLTLAGQFADDVALIDGGRLKLSGSPAEVLCEGVLQPSFGGQVRVIAGDDGTPVVVPMRQRRRADSADDATGVAVAADGAAEVALPGNGAARISVPGSVPHQPPPARQEQR